MKARLAALMISLLSWPSVSQKIEINFDVTFGDEKIGTLTATQHRKEKKLIQEVRSTTETKLLAISIQMESEIVASKENGILIEGSASRHSNRGADDIYAVVKKAGDKTYMRDRNGKTDRLTNTNITLCVADLYFAEPKGKATIFSNMHGEHVALKQLQPGIYELMTPDNKNSIYTYRSGKLVLIEVDTPAGKVITKRK